MPFPQTPVEPCKSGVTTVNSDGDILVCDASSGHQGQAETALSAQNYGLLSMRPRQQFDFGGRTGTIAYNTDLITGGGLGWWTSLFVTDQPYAGASDMVQVLGSMPQNGIGIRFDANCNTGNSTAVAATVGGVETFSNWTETDLSSGWTGAGQNANCVVSKRGSLNHVEVRLSQTQVSVYASDYSPDGVTFPNFRLLFQAPISLNFTRGYVHFQQAERAPLKYVSEFGISPGYANNYWSGIAFDGPVVAGAETGYSVPDALTADPNGGLNVGYALVNSPQGEYTCCPQTSVGAFSLPNVNLSGVGSAMLTFNVNYTYALNISPSNVAFHYRINGGAWTDPNPSPNYVAEDACSNCPGAPNGGGGVSYAFSVPLGSLVQDANTVEFTVDNSWNSYPPVLTNVELLTFGGSGPPPTPTPSPSPTATPQPNRTPADPSCAYAVTSGPSPTLGNFNCP